MEFEWDPVKNGLNKEKHGLPFEDAWRIFDDRHVIFPSHRNLEDRYGAIGHIENRCIVVFYTMRNNRYRIISMRRARADEKERYRQVYD